MECYFLAQEHFIIDIIIIFIIKCGIMVQIDSTESDENFLKFSFFSGHQSVI